MADPNQGTFPYRPLPDGADAIRLLTVQPGDFSDRLVCELETVLFSAKPRFTALSYTWQNPYIASQPSSNRLHDGDDRPRPHAPPTPDSPMVIISQGDHEFQVEVQHNLYLALLHLRSLTHPLTLWVDAVCINQDDMEERGCQVAIMSFIFTRALQVVVWLGPKDYGSRTDKTQRMHNDWRTGPVRMLATSLASNTESRGFSNVMQLDYSAEPDPATVNRIAASAYWTRLWIVQEMCLPQRVVLVYGSVMWRYEDFAGWNILAEARRPPLAQNYHHANPLTENSGIKAIFSLTDTRNARHSEKLRLERLVERFAGSHCTEI
ncbi:heterokaryon incompatibility protein-domain-containing protein, partial [Podospora didyma]